MSPEDGNLLPIGTDGVIGNWPLSSTGEVDQSLGVTPQSGESSGEVEFQLAFAGKAAQQTIDVLNAGTRAQANSFDIAIDGFQPPKDHELTVTRKGRGAETTLTRSGMYINPVILDNVGATYKMTFPAGAHVAGASEGR